MFKGKVTKIELETKLKLDWHQRLIFGRFWSHFGVQNRPKIDPEIDMEGKRFKDSVLKRLEAAEGSKREGYGE